MNINNVGNFIAQLRKEANMTQSDVADALHISHQAVSKWERLESLPDITILPGLAKLFDISIDELLNGKKKALEEKESINLEEETFINDLATQKVEEAKEILKKLENKAELLKEIAPITKPKVLDEIMEEVEIDLDQIEEFLPFLGANVLDKIINQAIVSGKVARLQSEIYPFLNNEHKNQLIDHYINQKQKYDLDDFYPFLNGEHREKLINYFFDRNKIDNLEDLYPFLSKEEKDLVIERICQSSFYEYIEDMMPFINGEQKDKIVEKALNDKIDKSILSDWAPFLNQEQLTRIILKSDK